MSQAKVDRYKEEKRNRAKIMKKQKMEWMLTKLGMSVVGLALVVWVGISAYNGLTASDETEMERTNYTVDISSLSDYLSGLEAEAE